MSSSSEKELRVRWEEFLAGYGSGFINVSVTYPLHKVMFRQMLYGVSASKAVHQLRKEGLGLLYRGLLPPLCQKTVSTAVMFGAYGFYGESLVHLFPNINAQLAKSIAAGFAGVSEAILTPFERIQTLLQDKHYNTKLNNSYHAVRHIWRVHGISEFYRGASTIILRNSTANVVFFALKEKAQQVVPAGNNMWTMYITDFVSGGLIGAAISTAYFPINVVKSRMQTRVGGAFESPAEVLKIVYVERGRKFSEMFRGVHLNYTRSLTSWGITNASYELLKRMLYSLSENTNDDR